ncbi:hypothetical protein SGRIM128S_06083 [Streptomyces griseomycini]
MSSPVRLSSFSRSSFFSRAYLLIRAVSAARKPSSCVPPSWVWMVLAKEYTPSLYPLFHCIATSSDSSRSLSSASMSITEGCTSSPLRELRYFTKSTMPPS